ncbi:MAG TPA: class I SAM-dependent methyltransferase [Polyangiaceae bacterium]|jgi:SAM-dependent methyltransferase
MPKDLLEEAELARAIAFPPDAEELTLSSDFIYAQVLFALWDSGFYDYVRRRPRFSRADAVAELRFDRAMFDRLAYYLIGRGILRAPNEAELELTDKGRRVTNTIARGLLNLYLGGYSGVLGNLGPLLRGEMTLGDPRNDRSARHAAAGTEDMTCVRVVPQVIETLKEHGVKGVLDLGCGTGGFLIQWARLTQGWGAGVDMSAPALAAARENAAAQGVADRLTFLLGEVGKDPLPLDADQASRIDAVTAMFMLHEFGRAGDGAIAKVLSSIQSRLPGKWLFALEMLPVDVNALGGRPPPALDALDYHFIHMISRQGEPRTKEVWERIYSEAGMRLVRVRRPKGAPLLVHMVQM